MNKLATTKKNLIKNALISSAILCAAVVAYFYVSGVTEKTLADKTMVEGTLQGIRTQIQMLDASAKETKQMTERFKVLKPQLKHQIMQQNLDHFKENLRLSRAARRFDRLFKIQLPPVQDVTLTNFPEERYQLRLHKDVAIELEAISDLHVYAFLDDLYTTLPGLVRYTSVELTRRMDMHPGVYRELLAGQSPSLVMAKIKFDWIGWKYKKPPQDNAAPAQ